MECHGNGPDHCCWIGGEVCPYLEEDTVPGRRWACGLLRRAGSWDAVYESVAYRRNVKPRLRAAIGGLDCGDWPQKYEGTERTSRCCFQGVTDADH